MWIVVFNSKKTGTRTNNYGPFKTSQEALAYAKADKEVDEYYEVVYLCPPREDTYTGIPVNRATITWDK